MLDISQGDSSQVPRTLKLQKKNSSSMKFDQSKITFNQSKIAEKQISQNFKSGPSPRKRLGFQSNSPKYKRKTPTTF